MNPSASIQEFDYYLPEDKIAKYPADERDLSNLLIATEEHLTKIKFRFIGEYLPSNALLVYNDTKVIPARFIFQKKTGARIEILLLNPLSPSDYQLNFQTTHEVIWEAMIGNASKWKDGNMVLEWIKNGITYSISAQRIGQNQVKFTWQPPSLTFGEILDMAASVPLPPYINRPAEEKDKETYQTVYAYHPGSVAAPTAGLHFTPDLLKKLQTQKNIILVPLTLHVGLGTFKPVKTDIQNHVMHEELVHIPAHSLKTLIEYSHRPWIVVGTTTLRALESLYYFLLHSLKGNHLQTIPQWISWHTPEQWFKPRNQLLSLFAPGELTSIQFSTRLMIVPGKPIWMGDYMITNFHQPRSTLLLLVDAFSKVYWKKIYAFALSNDFRFLSYGDACLLKNKFSPF